LAAATWAPSGSNLQLWQFVIVHDEDTLDKIKMFSPGLPKSAGCVIAVCIDLAEAEARGGALGKNDLAPMGSAFAAQNILLVAHDLGLGTCVVKSYNQESVHKVLAMPDQVAPLPLISVGYYDQAPATPARPSVESIVHYEKWQG